MNKRFIHFFCHRSIFFLFFLFLGLSGAWYLYVPKIIAYSSTFSYRANVQSVDNFYDPSIGVYKGEQRSATKFYFETLQSKDNYLDLKNVFDVRTLTGNPIFNVTRLYRIDSHTGRHITGGGDHDRSGYLFAPRMKGPLPQVPDKSSFMYWHVNYDVPAPMEFRDEELVLTLPTYRYEANFTADQTKDLTNLPGVGTKYGITLDVNLQLWIEPVTGHLVKYEDHTEAYYYDLKTGTRLYPWNNFHNAFTDTSIVEQVIQAQDEKRILFIKTFGVPLLLILIFIGVALMPLVRRTLSPQIRRNNARTIFPGTYALPVIAMCIGLLMTCLLTYYAFRVGDTARRTQFESDTSKIQSAISTRFDIYFDALRGSRGLFYASKSVERSEWKQYVQSLELERNYPGIRALGYIPVITRADLPLYSKHVQAEGLKDFVVYPETTASILTPVTYIEPFDIGNQGTLGFDMSQEPVRHEAIVRARDTNAPALSGTLTLIQDKGSIKPGFLVYLPIYQNHNLPNTLIERQKNIGGFTYMAFRMSEFMTGILSTESTQISIRVYDGLSSHNLDRTRFMYASDNVSLVSTTSPRIVRTLTVAGHSWTVEYVQLSGYGENLYSRLAPIIVFVVSLLLSALLSYLFLILGTRKNKAEQLARELTKSLEGERARDEAILANIGDALVVTDTVGGIVLVNPAFEKSTGWSAQEVFGRKLTDVISMQREDGTVIEPMYRPMSTVLTNRDSVASSLTEIPYYVRKDGSRFPIAITVTPVTGGKEFIGAVEVFRDITHERDIDKAKTEFVSLASHQLRTPLSAINWYAEMLIAGDAGKISKKQRKYLDEIYTGNQRMVELVNALLDVSRLELGTFAVDPALTDLAELAKDVINEQQPTVVTRRIQFTQALADDLPLVLIDPKQIRMVFQNLLSNALKYTPEGGAVSFSLQLSKDKQKVDLNVADTGYGITKSQQDKVFTKLFRADNVREKDTEGTGLGLYIVKSIIDHSGGTIRFESKENKGTTFFVTLPISGIQAKKQLDT